MIKTKVFSSNEEFETWQQEAIDKGDARKIHQISPIIGHSNFNQQCDKYSDVTDITDGTIGVSYHLFVVYLED